MKQASNSKLLTIVGPTGVGKTALAIELAKQFDGELVSADSRQIYIGMDIATGKEVGMGEWQQMDGRRTLVIDDMPIHGLDLAYPDDDFSIFDWQQRIRPIIDEIRQRNKLPVVVGGTGFYLLALQGLIETLAVKPDTALRDELRVLSEEELAERLKMLDEKAYALVDTQNRRRLIRAIEVAESSNQEVAQRMMGESYDLNMIGLTMERNALYAKVDARVEQMFAEGLVEETRQLLAKYDRRLPSMTGIGYAEVGAYLDGELSLDEARQKMKWRVHSYIRRQYTWFRKQKVNWVDVGQPGWRNAVMSAVEEIV